MTKSTICIGFICFLTFSSAFTQSDHKAVIKSAIENMVNGGDAQDGDMLSKAFWEDASLFATQGEKILKVSCEDFIDLHISKKFGGHQRQLDIQSVQIEPNGVAAASVIAENDALFYQYYLGFTKKEGEWRIQTFLQHSRKK